MYRFTFVILHYLTAEDTIECVESIIANINYENFKIIIIDNGSTNNSGKQLSDEYSKHENVEVVIKEVNIGYARGNNIGYKIAKEDHESDFIILLNNDTLILQEKFIDVIIEKYHNEHFHVLGPDIVSLIDNHHQNPQRIKSKKDLIILILITKIKLLFNYLRFEKFLRRFINLLSNHDREPISEDYQEEQINVQLHGSCLIFSPEYVERFEGLCPKTFLYLEEDILFYKSVKAGLKLLYTPDIVVYHKEDSSTTAMFNDHYLSRRFEYKNKIRSSKILLDMINKDG